MKSAKRKTTKKQNVLIAFNKGIASAQSIELAMLFSHAGFDVKSIFFDGAEEYVSAAAIKDITEHTPWSSTHKPGWLKADFKFDTGIIIEPDFCVESQPSEDAEKSNPCAESKTNEFINCINNKCRNIKILTSKKNIEGFNIPAKNIEVIPLPDNLLKLHEVLEQILSDAVKLTASKALNGGITYSFSNNATNLEYYKELETAFEEYGFEEVSTEPENAEICINKGDKTIQIALERNDDKHPDKNLIYINRHKNGLVLTDSIETRLLPDFSCKSCFSKLMEYLREEMERE